MPEKTDFFLIYGLRNFLFFLDFSSYICKSLKYICLVYLNIVKRNVYSVGFPDFRSTLPAKHSGKRKNCLYTNCISSSCSVSINTWVLRTIFHVAHLSADQRTIQKKDEHRFSIFDRGHLHKEELTGQTKWDRHCRYSWIAVLCWIWIEISHNLGNWIQQTGNNSQLLSTIT